MDFGLAPNAGDLANAKGTLASAQAAVAAAELSKKQNCYGLLDLLKKAYADAGICDALVDTDPPAQPSMTLAQAEEYAKSNREDLKTQKEVIEAQKDIEKEYRPLAGLSLGLTASATHNSGSGGPGSSALSSSSGLPVSSSTTGNDFRVGLGFQYQLDFHRAANLDAAKHTERMQTAQLSAQTGDVLKSVRTDYAGLDLANANVAQYLVLYNSQKLALDITKKTLDIGKLPSSLLYVQVLASYAAANAANATAQLNVREALNQIQYDLGNVTAGNTVDPTPNIP